MVIDTGKKPRLIYSHSIGLALFQRGRGFSTPVDIAFSSENKMYTVSRSISRPQPDQGGIRIGISTTDFEAEYFGEFSGYGSKDGQTIWPTGIAFDKDDVLYMLDEHLHRVTMFNKKGDLIGTWGVAGELVGQLNGPSSIVFDQDNNCFIVDSLNNRVQKFTRDGKLLHSFGSFGNGTGEFYLPWGINIDSEENIYVADWRNDRIQKFDKDGKFIRIFGSSGKGHGEFNRPSHIAIDSDGFMYVADWGNERVQVLNSEGQFIQELRGESGLSKWAEDYFASAQDEAKARSMSNLEPDLGFEDPWEESSFVEKLFWGPISIKINSEGKIFVVESNRHRIQIFNVS